MDLLAPGAAPTAILLGSRMGGLLLIAPVFSAKTVPMTLRTALLVVFTILLAPLAFAHLEAPPALTPASMLMETLIGFAIGLGAAVFVGAAEAVGDLLAIHIGLSGAAALDPLNQSSIPVLGQFVSLFTVTLLLALDAHLVMLDAIAASARLLPVGVPLEVQPGILAMLRLGSMLFALGLQFAAPVIATVLVANVALAILARAAPQLNILAVAFPVQIGVGLFALAASLPLLGAAFGNWADAYDATLARVLGALVGGG